MQQIIFFLPLSLKTQRVSALDGHLQVSIGNLGPKHVVF
jgi:hypothetical protein